MLNQLDSGIRGMQHRRLPRSAQRHAARCAPTSRRRRSRRSRRRSAPRGWRRAAARRLGRVRPGRGEEAALPLPRPLRARRAQGGPGVPQDQGLDGPQPARGADVRRSRTPRRPRTIKQRVRGRAASRTTRATSRSATGRPFPTLEQMIDSGRRLWVMAEDKGDATGWYRRAYDGDAGDAVRVHERRAAALAVLVPAEPRGHDAAALPDEPLGRGLPAAARATRTS